MPVLEALLDERAVLDRVVIARTAHGDAIDEILSAARARGVRVERADQARVTKLSRNGRHDQGVVAAVASPGLAELDAWLPHRHGALSLVVLDGVTNPANVGMIIRSVVAAGLDGLVLPVAGSPDVGPLVVKASAGVALFGPVLRTPTALDAVAALRAADVHVVGLGPRRHASLWETTFPTRVALVVGNETAGVSHTAGALVQDWCHIPLGAGVDSLNVASAVAVAAFELARRRATRSP
jgi:23S rRNA (guanosine2251-2'-O)-methyltransferase